MGLSAYKIILHPLEKYMYKKEKKNRGSVSSSSFSCLLRLMCFTAVLVGLKIPSGAVEPRCVRDTGTDPALGVRVPVQTMLVVGSLISTLAARCVGELCDRPFMCTQIISVTYVHNLQRTTPTAFGRFSCVLRRSACPCSLAAGLIIITLLNKTDCSRAAPLEGSGAACLCLHIKRQPPPEARYVTFMLSSLPLVIFRFRAAIVVIHLFSHNRK